MENKIFEPEDVKHKNIYKTKYGTFRVHIMRNKKRVLRTFVTLNEALTFRDDRLSELDILINDWIRE